MKILRTLLIFWLPVLLWMSFIYILSDNHNPYRALPNSRQEPAVDHASGEKPLPGKDDVPSTALRLEYEALGRLGHAIEYALLGYLLARALTSTFAAPFSNHRAQLFLFAAVLAFLFGFSDEIHQSQVAGRTFQIVDLILDALGSAAGVLIFVKRRGSSSGLEDRGG